MVDASVSLLFRPSIIITLGQSGKLISEHLSPYPNPTTSKAGATKRMTGEPVSVYHLLAGVDGLLRKSIALLHVVPEVVRDGNEVVKVGGKPVVSLQAIPIPLERDFPPDPHMPKDPGNFRRVFLDVLRSVQAESRIAEMTLKKYSILNTRTQIFIVGEADNQTMPWMATILQIIRESVTETKYHFEPVVCYFLNCNDVDGDYSAMLRRPPTQPGLQWKDYHLANFSYLFEPVIPLPQPVFVFEDEMQYATAQAVFGLAATGITSLEQFKDILTLNQEQLEDYAEHVGSFSTSMIQFPHQPAVRFCSASLVKEMMLDWRESHVTSNVSEEGRYALADRARNVEGDMLGWMADSEERPGADGSSWPSLDILRRDNHPISKSDLAAQREIYVRLKELTKQMFSSFSEEDIREAFANQAGRSWDELANAGSNKAMSLHLKWANQARTAWDAATQRLDAEINRVVYDFFEKDHGGSEEARIFIDALDNRLEAVKDNIDVWRTAHSNVYKALLGTFDEKMGDGRGSTGRMSSIMDDDLPDAEQLRPTMSRQHPAMNADVDSLRFPADEESIAVGLARRIALKQALTPMAATLFGTGLLGFLASAIMLASFNLALPLQLSISSALSLVLILSNIILYIQRSRDLQEARRDILEFYRQYFVHQCQLNEDAHRTRLIYTVQRNVEMMRKKLDTFSEVCTRHASQATRDAEQVNQQLFDGPAGRRDVFVAGGERLEQTGPHTLGSVAERVGYDRITKWQKDWHHSLSDMRHELIVRTRGNNVNLLTLDDDELQQYLYNFMAEVVNEYLIGSLVNIGAALDKQEIWDEVWRRVGQPMYYAGVGLLDPKEIFVCGRPPDLKRSKAYIPPKAIQVRTNSEEWLIVVASYRGGQPTKLVVDKLFPVK